MKKLLGLFAGTVASLSLTMGQAPDAAAAPAASRAAQEAALLAALPPDKTDVPASFQAMNDSEAARLTGLNPGKGKIIHAILARTLVCKIDALGRMADRTRPQAIHALSDDSLARLTAFYSGPDYRRALQLKKKAHLTQAEQAEAKAFSARYAKPMDELQTARETAIQNAMPTILSSPDYMALVQTCIDGMAAAYKKEKIRMD